MTKKIEWYKHHGVTVAVRRDLHGKHREYCLCYQCKRFDSNDGGGNCAKADRFFDLCGDESITAPVWECPAFESRRGAANRVGPEL